MKVIDTIYDIETTSLNIHDKHIHCIGIKQRIDGVFQDTKVFTSHWTYNSDGNLNAALKLISETTGRLIGFNNIKFDDPYIENYYDVILNCDKLDLMLLSKILFTKDQLIAMDRGIPEIPPADWGKYSLDTFGKRLGVYKESYSDWTKLTPEMAQYCKQDVEVTATLLTKLESMPKYPTQDVINLENSVASIIAKQERYGFYFDVPSARELNTRMLFKKGSIERKLVKIFRPKFLPDGPPKETNKLIKRKTYIEDTSYSNKWSSCKPYRRPLTKYKSGKIKLPAKTKYKWFSTPHKLIYTYKAGEFQNIKLTKFNPGSRQHIVKWLHSMYGWKPNVFTPSGNPKVDADTLDNLPYDEAKPLKDYLKLVKDLGQLSQGQNSLLNLVGPDSRFHGNVDTLGANTGRMTHNRPNITQIPKSEEFRKLLCVPDGKVLIDVDADALELVMLGHYLGPYDDYFYAKTVDSGDKSASPPTDIHSVNQRATGLATRDLAKTLNKLN